MNPSKPLGPTTLPFRGFNEGSAAFARPLTELFNAYLVQKRIPSELKLANRIPLYKKYGTNFRPIPITTVFSKISYKMQMEDYLHANKFINQQANCFEEKNILQ